MCSLCLSSSSQSRIVRFRRGADWPGIRLAKWSGPARRKFVSIVDMRESRVCDCLVVSLGGGGGAEVLVVWEMHRAGWKERCDVRRDNVRLRKARRAVFCDMLGGFGY